MTLSQASLSQTTSLPLLKDKLKKLNKAGKTTFPRTMEVRDIRKAKKYITSSRG